MTPPRDQPSPIRLEYAEPRPRKVSREPLHRALAILCLLAGIPLCGMGIAVAAMEIDHPKPATLMFLVIGAVLCFFGLNLNRHRKHRWVRGIYIPDMYLSTVRLLRTAFADGLPADLPEYSAICLFLDHEGIPPRQIAQTLVFSFDIEYAHAINALESMETDPTPAQTIARMEQRLTPHGLQSWRTER